jgi:hypothetical protein
MEKNQAIKNVLLIFLSATFSLAIIEGFLAWRPELQARRPFEDFVFCAGAPQEGQSHDLFGWTAVPEGAYFVEKNDADGWVVYINNAEGFRDLYDSGSQHTIVLGDSFAAGSNANNDEAFPHLLDLWNSDMAFHNFGVGGYGSGNSLSVYEFVSSRIPHELVILAYFLGNDLRDNLEYHDQRRHLMPPREANSGGWYDTLKNINSTVRQFSRSYNLLYEVVRPRFGDKELAREEIERGVDITDEILSRLAIAVGSNNADLLIVMLPSWNQINNYSGNNEEEQQRILINKLEDKMEHVYVLDVKQDIESVGVNQFYGVVDKHLSSFGYYTMARVIHDWINFNWPRGPRAERYVAPFQPRAASVHPDCSLMAEHREAFANSEASRRELTAQRGVPPTAPSGARDPHEDRPPP